MTTVTDKQVNAKALERPKKTKKPPERYISDGNAKYIEELEKNS